MCLLKIAIFKLPHPTWSPSIKSHPLIAPRCYIHLRWHFFSPFHPEDRTATKCVGKKIEVNRGSSLEGGPLTSIYYAISGLWSSNWVEPISMALQLQQSACKSTSENVAVSLFIIVIIFIRNPYMIRMIVWHKIITIVIVIIIRIIIMMIMIMIVWHIISYYHDADQGWWLYGIWLFAAGWPGCNGRTAQTSNKIIIWWWGRGSWIRIPDPDYDPDDNHEDKRW